MTSILGSVEALERLRQCLDYGAPALATLSGIAGLTALWGSRPRLQKAATISSPILAFLAAIAWLATAGVTSQIIERRDEVRRTPPQVDARLSGLEGPTAFIELESQNRIPFEYRYMIVTKSDLVVSGVPMEFTAFYPTHEKWIARVKVTLQRERIVDGFLEVRVVYHSVSQAELGYPPAGAGRITRKYKIDGDQFEELR